MATTTNRAARRQRDRDEKKSPRRNGGTFDADKKAQERRQRKIIIGGADYFPAKHTGKLLKSWIDTLPDDSEDRDLDSPTTKDDLMDNIDLLYEQVSILIVDGEEKHPDPEALSEVLESDEANEIIRDFSPGAGMVEEARRPTSPAAS